MHPANITYKELLKKIVDDLESDSDIKYLFTEDGARKVGYKNTSSFNAFFNNKWHQISSENRELSNFIPVKSTTDRQFFFCCACGCSASPHHNKRQQGIEFYGSIENYAKNFLCNSCSLLENKHSKLLTIFRSSYIFNKLKYKLVFLITWWNLKISNNSNIKDETIITEFKQFKKLIKKCIAKVHIPKFSLYRNPEVIKNIGGVALMRIPIQGIFLDSISFFGKIYIDASDRSLEQFLPHFDLEDEITCLETLKKEVDAVF